MAGGALKRRHAVARLYAHLHSALGIFVAGTILFVTIGISVDVLLRNTGLGVVPWMLEATEYCLFLATFLGAPWVLHLGEHVRIDMLVNRFPPRLGAVVELLTNLAGLAVSATLLWYGAKVALVSRADGARVIKELIFPEWWIFAVVAASSLLLCVEFVVRLRNALAAPRRDGAARRQTGAF